MKIHFLIERTFNTFLASSLRRQSAPSDLLNNARKHLIPFFRYSFCLALGKVISMATQIYLGRTLGAEVFGQISIILLLASFLYVPMTNGWGLALVKMISTTTDTDAKYSILKATLFVSLFFTVISVSALFFFRNMLCDLFSISHSMMKYTIFVTISSAIWFLSKNIAQAFQNWSMYIKIEVYFAVINSIIVILAFNLTDKIGYKLVLAFVISYIISSLFAFNKVVQSLFTTIIRSYFIEVLSRGYLLMSTALVSLISFSLDRIFIYRYLGSEIAGIYQAHFISTYGIMSTFMAIFFNYIFPLLCQTNYNITNIRFRVLYFYGYIIIISTSLILGHLIIYLFNYPFNTTLFILFCIFNAIYFHGQLKMYVMASKTIKSTKFVLFGHIIFFIINIISLILFLPLAGVSSGGIALLISSTICLFYITRVE